MHDRVAQQVLERRCHLLDDFMLTERRLAEWREFDASLAKMSQEVHQISMGLVVRLAAVFLLHSFGFGRKNKGNAIEFGR